MTDYLQRSEGRLAYDITGVGPLVICAPGMGDLRSSYRHVVPALAAAGFRVATLDLRGHGESDIGFSAYDDLALASDAEALIESLGGPALIVGNSMAAGAAVLVAADRPELVAGLALVGPFVRNQSGAAALLAPLFRVLLARPWGRTVLKAWQPKLYAGAVPVGHAEQMAAVFASLGRPQRWRAFQRTARTSHAPVTPRLGDVATPVLVVMGELDPDFRDPASEAAWIAQQLRGDVVMVGNAGHYPHAQRPDVVVPALVEFLDRVFADA